jgi:hypothetical protein
MRETKKAEVLGGIILKSHPDRVSKAWTADGADDFLYLEPSRERAIRLRISAVVDRPRMVHE